MSSLACAAEHSAVNEGGFAGNLMSIVVAPLLGDLAQRDHIPW